MAIAASGYNGDTQRIIKFSPSGTILWQVTYPEYGCGISNVVEMPNSNLVFTNCYYPPDDFRTDMAIFKLSANGNLRWWRRYGVPAHNDYGYDIILAQDGGFIVTGRQDTTDGASVWLVHTNCMGLLTQPAAAFSYEPQPTPNLMKFTNQSLYVYADSIDGGYYVWDWGDGTPPNTFTTESFTEVYHYFPAPGAYPVTLTAIVCTDTSVVQALIDTQGAGGTVGIAPQNSPPFEVAVYPNPAQNILTLQWVSKSPLGDLGVSLLTLTGQTVLETTLAAGEVGKTISVAHLPAGIYLCRWQQSAGGTSGYVKVVVVH
ncbi:T9SS C-terminal target domain-containing protein [Sphingobacteriales bacterium UPWRP_1]|nr:hypothetical protein B6N25_08425 [Sphingobacteriales bacterium TSM_CSS]PSJ71587.1 T9SS C-terminal target domain-containing protein [Sphingobacteriales bacterium UPWRP_1]